MIKVPGRFVVEFCVQKNGFQNLKIWKCRYVTKKSLEIQIQNFELLKTFSGLLFDEDSIALVSAGSLALVFELRCIDSKFSKNRKKGHARVKKATSDVASAPSKQAAPSF